MRERLERGSYTLAAQAIRAKLLALAANPHAVKQSPWAMRPFCCFTIKVDEVVRPIRVVFRYDEDEKGITIIEFEPQLF